MVRASELPVHGDATRGPDLHDIWEDEGPSPRERERIWRKDKFGIGCRNTGRVFPPASLQYMGNRTAARDRHLSSREPAWGFMCGTSDRGSRLASTDHWLLLVRVTKLCTLSVFTMMSAWLGKYVTLGQKDWLESIEKRVNFTSEIFGSIKSVMMFGLAEKMAALIDQCRAEEIAVMKKSRMLLSINV